MSEEKRFFWRCRGCNRTGTVDYETRVKAEAAGLNHRNAMIAHKIRYGWKKGNRAETCIEKGIEIIIV